MTPADGTPIWQLSAMTWQERQGIHQPHICEISPHQYAGMSKRQQRAYDDKRRREWAASAHAKNLYAALVLAAFRAGEFSLDDPRVDSDAAGAVKTAQLTERKATKKLAWDDAVRANEIESTDQVKKGDRVFTIMGGYYGRVVKISKRSVRIEVENAPDYMQGRGPIKVNLGALQWLKYSDLQTEFETDRQEKGQKP